MGFLSRHYAGPAGYGPYVPWSGIRYGVIDRAHENSLTGLTSAVGALAGNRLDHGSAKGTIIGGIVGALAGAGLDALRHHHGRDHGNPETAPPIGSSTNAPAVNAQNEEQPAPNQGKINELDQKQADLNQAFADHGEGLVVPRAFEKMSKDNPSAAALFQAGGFEKSQNGFNEFFNFTRETLLNPQAYEVLQKDPSQAASVVSQWRQDVKASGQNPASPNYRGGAQTVLDNLGQAPASPAAPAELNAPASADTPEAQAPASPTASPAVTRSTSWAYDQKHAAEGNKVIKLGQENGLYVSVDKNGKVLAGATIDSHGKTTAEFTGQALQDKITATGMKMEDVASAAGVKFTPSAAAAPAPPAAAPATRPYPFAS